MGRDDLSYALLLREDYPSWLYEVKLGATTVWERWNSLLPDGSISSTGMNSLNHYAYGSILEWMFARIGGIQPMEQAPGFREALLCPAPDQRVGYGAAELHTASGLWKSAWKLENGLLRLSITVPFYCTGHLALPGRLTARYLPVIRSSLLIWTIKAAACCLPVNMSWNILGSKQKTDF